MKKRVVAAMSGGVDSSVAAALLLEQGYEVIGITLNVWPSEQSCLGSKTCCSQTDVDDARHVCEVLGIPHYVLNMREPFREKVIDYFVKEYLKGGTPNPCIACNTYIKFGALLEKARALEAEAVATGHYALLARDEKAGELCLKRSKDNTKDQTYVLYNLTQEQLGALMLPCGGLTKTQVREKARELGLPTFSKAESQDICFIGKEGYKEFIRNYCERFGLELPKGGFVTDRDGHVLGRHEGIHSFTVGQRKGLGKYTNVRSFVTKIDPETSAVVLGTEQDLFSSEMTVENVNVMLTDRLADNARVNVKIRYSAPEAPAVVRWENNSRLKVLFETPQRAVTRGQAAVFYQEDLVLGGGTIL